MFSGSYAPEDVTFLLKPVEMAETPIAEKERMIQSGQRHYSEMITRERPPSRRYLEVFHEGVARSKRRLADDIIALAGLIAARREGEIVLVSLARAGTPIGVLLARTLRRHFGRGAAHYSVSIIRDRGIDDTALRHVLARHSARGVVFVDGWTGKGVIAAELKRAVDRFNADTGAGVDPGLFAVADLSGTAAAAATAEDYLIPSCVLGATVSGLVSRSILNAQVVAPGDFHGCVYYREYEKEDLSRWFADEMTAEIAAQWRQRGSADDQGPGAVERQGLRERSVAFLAQMRERHGVTDVNFVKPGIGEATRVLLRRVPGLLLLRDAELPEVAHLRVLAAEKDVPVITAADLPYRAAALIQAVDG